MRHPQNTCRIERRPIPLEIKGWRNGQGAKTKTEATTYRRTEMHRRLSSFTIALLLGLALRPSRAQSHLLASSCETLAVGHADGERSDVSPSYEYGNVR